MGAAKICPLSDMQLQGLDQCVNRASPHVNLIVAYEHPEAVDDLSMARVCLYATRLGLECPEHGQDPDRLHALFGDWTRKRQAELDAAKLCDSARLLWEAGTGASDLQILKEVNLGLRVALLKREIEIRQLKIALIQLSGPTQPPAESG